MRNIVIAPKESFSTLFSLFRKDDPFNDPKFFTKEDLKKEVLYSYSDDALIYLIKTRKFEYSLAKKYLEALSSLTSYDGTNKEIIELIKIRDELVDNGLLIKNEYIDYELDHSNIFVAFYNKNDFEISSLLKGRKYSYIESSPASNRESYHFKDSSSELFFVFNKIAELIASGVPSSEISIYGLDDVDTLTILRLLDYYHLNINGFNDEKMIDSSIVRYFLSNYDSEDILQKIDERFLGDNNYDLFKEIIDKFSISELSKDEQKRLFREVFNNKKSSRKIYKDAIKVVNSPFVKENEYLFIVNFVQGKFPTIIKDNGLLDDKDNIELGHTSLNNLNFDNNELFKNSLNQNAHIYISYSDNNANGPLYPSPLKKDLNISFVESPISKDLYSKLECNIQSAYHEDLFKDFLIDSPLLRAYRLVCKIPYLTYSNKYNKAIHFLGDQHLSLSSSSLKEFYQCGYRFYLNRILKIDPKDESSYVAKVGNISHYILENLESKKSFDELFSTAVKLHGKNFNEKEKFLLEIRKEHFKKAFDYIKEQESHIVNPKVNREDSDFNVDLDDYLSIVGRIDKYVTYGEHNEYVFVVDYKSGSEDFDEKRIPFGLSLQLPIYALLIKNTPILKDKILTGLFIQKTYNKDALKFKEGDSKYFDNLKLTGVYLSSVKAMSMLDDSLLSSGTSKYIASCTLLKPNPDDPNPYNRSFSAKSNRFKNEEWFENVIKQAEDLSKNAYKKIHNNEFEINPKYLNGQNVSCAYCPFKDLCFKTNKDMQFISNEENGENERS